jgi:SNF2 family DNA or RNA helicase
MHGQREVITSFPAKMKSALKTAVDAANSGIKGRLDGNYQRNGVEWMLKKEIEHGEGGILADDMGLGKTMQTIALMRGNLMPTLIVSIVGTVNQWRDALIDFGGFRPLIVNPSFVGILPDNDNTKDFVVLTTYSSFQKSKPPACLYAKSWGRIVLDEGHTIRNPSTITHKSIAKLSAKFKWILSGTPIQNGEKDILSLAHWIGASKGTDINEIVERMVLRRTQEQQGTLIPRLALPPLNTSVVRLEFADEAEEELYANVEEYFAGKSDSNFDVMEGLTRCRQICTNPRIYMTAINQKCKKRKKPATQIPNVSEGSVGSTKFDYLVKDINASVKGGKCLVFCTWTLEMKYLQDALNANGVSSLIYDGHLSRDNKEAVLYNFKNTTIPVLILQINCGSAGLNLQCANKVYITSPNWNPCVELQAIGRAYRKGQQERVTCVRMVMANTIEDRCMAVQERKMQLIAEAMKDDSLSSRLGKVVGDDFDIKDLFAHKYKKSKKRKIEEDVDVDGAIEATGAEAEAGASANEADPIMEGEGGIVLKKIKIKKNPSCIEETLSLNLDSPNAFDMDEFLKEFGLV